MPLVFCGRRFLNASLCHHDRNRLCCPYCGTCFARHRRRATTAEGTSVRSNHTGSRSSIRVGDELAPSVDSTMKVPKPGQTSAIRIFPTTRCSWCQTATRRSRLPERPTFGGEKDIVWNQSMHDSSALNSTSTIYIARRASTEKRLDYKSLMSNPGIMRSSIAAEGSFALSEKAQSLIPLKIRQSCSLRSLI